MFMDIFSGQVKAQLRKKFDLLIVWGWMRKCPISFF